MQETLFDDGPKLTGRYSARLENNGHAAVEKVMLSVKVFL